MLRLIDAPPDAVAELIGQPLGLRPRTPVDEEEHVGPQLQKCGAGIVFRGKLSELVAREAGPLGDDEDRSESAARSGGSTMNAPESCVSSEARNGSGIPVVVAQ